MSTASKIRWVGRGVLVLAIVALLVYRAGQKPKAHGLMVRTVTSECDLSRNGLDRAIRLRVSADGRMWLNLDEVEPAVLQSRLHLIYKTRAEKVLFVDAADGLALQQVADLLGRSSASAPGLRIILVTPSVRKRCEELWRIVLPAGGS
ncbi:MAG: hypothetical protein M3O85_00670 [Acidobacteriota bacterium]|nr:hypothetical protein [Acidobacteriota bacterium]